MAVSSSAQPTELRRLPAEGRLAVVWSDGHRGEYDYDTLRGFCPCASCQGHGPGPLRFQAPARPVDLLSIEPVGNYGVSFHWSDGHATGIYRFDYLRQLCPCAACAAAGKGSGRRGEEREEKTP